MHASHTCSSQASTGDSAGLRYQAGRNFQGLQQAARCLRVAVLVPNHFAKQLSKLDIANAVVRQINTASSTIFYDTCQYHPCHMQRDTDNSTCALVGEEDQLRLSCFFGGEGSDPPCVTTTLVRVGVVVMGSARGPSHSMSSPSAKVQQLQKFCTELGLNRRNPEPKHQNHFEQFGTFIDVRVGQSDGKDDNHFMEEYVSYRRPPQQVLKRGAGARS